MRTRALDRSGLFYRGIAENVARRRFGIPAASLARIDALLLGPGGHG